MPTSGFHLAGDAIPLDAVALRWDAEEALSEPFTCTVRFATRDASVRLENVVRTSAALVLDQQDLLAPPRVIHGVIEEARFVRTVDATSTFEVVLRPALSALAHREGCRIFQEKTIPQIVQSVFDDAGFGDRVEWRLTAEYPPREYVVQWRETHLAFVHRLLEEVGIFYAFEHTLDGHRLILGDGPDVVLDPPAGVLPILGERQSGGLLAVPGADVAWDLERTRRIRTTEVHLRDTDFEKPQVAPEAHQAAEDAWPAPYYEFPARFTRSAEGQVLAAARLRELRRDADVLRGESHCAGLLPGAPFMVQGTRLPCHAGEFVVTRLRSHGTQAIDGGSVEGTLRNTLEAIPRGTAWAPPRRTPRPRIRGVQTAVVTGSSQQAQTIHTDAHGRIKVRFFWDRQGQQDHTSSCWIRCSQLMLGGSMILPRVGWEVSVAFLEGDPDRPVVLGRVDNGENVPPLGLPGAKTSGSLKSMSSPGAGGHNALHMGDSGGSQGFDVHAQKDFNVTIGNDKVEEVGVNEVSHVNTNATETVGANRTTRVGSDQSLDVGAALTQKIGGSQTITIGGNDTTNAIANFLEKIGADRAYTVGGTQITIQNGIRTQAQGSIARTIGAVQLTGTPSTLGDAIVGNLDETVGAVKIVASIANIGEKVGGSKDATSVAAELHLTKGGIEAEAAGPVTNLVGGLHWQKLGGDLAIKAPLITLLGATGSFKGGGSELKLGGGPIVLKGGKIAVKSALVVKMSGSMKLGS